MELNEKLIDDFESNMESMVTDMDEGNNCLITNEGDIISTSDNEEADEPNNVKKGRQSAMKKKEH